MATSSRARPRSRATSWSTHRPSIGKREPAVAEHWGSLWAHYTFQQGRFEGFGFGGGVRYIGETFGGD